MMAEPMLHGAVDAGEWAMAHDEPDHLRANLLPLAQTVKARAAHCDAMCLSAGVQLGEAVPGIYELSSRFASLSTMLDGDEGATATSSLETVAQEIANIGNALAGEGETLKALLKLNGVLSRHIDHLSEHVRFLSAAVSNVKIELASIKEDGLRLDSFAETLQQLTTKSQTTLNAFQTAHEKLVDLLRRTVKVQSSFETSQRTKLATAAGGLTSSLDVVKSRRRTVAAIASEIGKLTQQIGMQIAQSVVALQIGDSTRQRLEHAGDALSLAADLSVSGNPESIFDDDAEEDIAARRARLAAQICALQSPQTAQAIREFSSDIRKIQVLLEEITGASLALLKRGRDLVSSPGHADNSFLSHLEGKLALGRDLIGECSQSRKLVDDTVEQVVLTVLDLDRLATDVAGMATDMTIIGTNAVVTSYRLGSRGLALSVIAQHLRTHALHVADAVGRIRPSLADVLESAKGLTSERQGQDAASMNRLASEMTQALTAFQSGDRTVADVTAQLEAEVSSIGGLLRQAVVALQDVSTVDAELADVVATLDGLEGTEQAAAPDPALDLLLRRHYTMESERQIHDAFVGPSGAAHHASSPAPVVDDVWL